MTPDDFAVKALFIQTQAVFCPAFPPIVYKELEPSCVHAQG